MPWESQVKNLSVVLDSKFSFRPHIKYVRNKATCAMSRLYPLICKRSKVSLRNKLTLYKTCIRPIMTYACVVFAHTKIDLLQRVQNKFLRMPIRMPDCQDQSRSAISLFEKKPVASFVNEHSPAKQVNPEEN